MAGGPGGGVAVEDIPGRMAAADPGQHLVREGLRVDGNAGGPVLLDDGQLFGVGAVGAAGLHRVFVQPAQGEVVPHRPHQLAQLGRRQAGGGAPADVDRLQLQPRLVRLAADGFQLPAQAVHIGLHQPAVPVQVAADKAAVAAPGGAEGDADVQAVGPGLAAPPEDGLLQPGDGLGHAVFFFRAVEPLQKQPVDLRLGPAGGPLVMDQADRADAGHLAPGGAQAGPFPQQAVGQAGQGKFRGLTGGQRGGGGLAAPVFPHGHPQALRAAAGPQAVLAVFRRGQGKGRHGVKDADQMLHIVARGQPSDIDLHGVSPVCTRS